MIIIGNTINHYLYSCYRHKDTKTDIHQPDGYNFEQCTAIILDSILNTQIWHDVPCAYNNINYFMCETKQNILEDKGKVADKICGRSLPSKIPVYMNSIFMKLYVT